MALTSSSTYTNAIAQYNDSLRWWASESAAKNHLEAIEWLIGNRAGSMSDGGSSLNYDDLENKRRDLVRFLGLNTSTTSRAHFTRGRSQTRRAPL
jgi:hypothetical protein